VRREGLNGPGRRSTGGLASDLTHLRLAPRGETRRAEKSRRAAQPSMARGRWEEDRTGPPVMVRGGYESPLRTSPRKHPAKNRRRYDFALSVPGAEMRLPALPQVHIGWRVVSAAIVAVLLAALYQLWNSPDFRVQEVGVTGLVRLTSTDVNHALGIEGEPIFTISPSELEKNIKAAFPEFSSVSVHVGLRNKVDVTVEERLPILTWRQGDRTVLVDANGFGFPQREGGPEGPALTVQASGDLPAIEPEVKEDALTEKALTERPLTRSALTEWALTPIMRVEMVSAILSMSSQAPANATLVYDAQHGLGWKDSQGWDVFFGDLRDMGMKLSVYRALIDRLQRDDLHPVLISVEHVNAPYYRLEQ
jgi:hypothetical protein